MYDRALTNTVDTNSPVVRPIVQRGLINLESNSVKNILQFYFNLDRLRSISISDLLSYLTSGRNLSNPNPNPNFLTLTLTLKSSYTEPISSHLEFK